MYKKMLKLTSIAILITLIYSFVQSNNVFADQDFPDVKIEIKINYDADPISIGAVKKIILGQTTEKELIEFLGDPDLVVKGPAFIQGVGPSKNATFKSKLFKNTKKLFYTRVAEENSEKYYEWVFSVDETTGKIHGTSMGGSIQIEKEKLVITKPAKKNTAQAKKDASKKGPQVITLDSGKQVTGNFFEKTDDYVVVFYITKMTISFDVLEKMPEEFISFPIAENEKIQEDVVNICFKAQDVISKTGVVSEAIPLYWQAIKKAPQDPGAYFLLGDTHHFLGEWAKAIHYYKKAIELNPSFVEAYEQLAKTYTIINQPENAISCYQEISKYTKNTGHKSLYLYINMATSFIMKKDYAQAEDYALRACAFYPETLDKEKMNATDYVMFKEGYISLSWLFLTLEQYDKAIFYGEKYLENYNSQNDFVWSYIIASYLRKGEKDKAKKLYDENKKAGNISDSEYLSWQYLLKHHQK